MQEAQEMQLEEEAMLRRVFPLKVSVHHSDSVNVQIAPYAYTEGILLAIRVQDIPRDLWANWNGQTRTWDTFLDITPGSKTLYIAVAAINAGSVAGSLTLTIVDDTGKVLATKAFTVQPWNGSWTAPNDFIGVETGSIDMPNRPYSVTISVTP